MRLLQPVTALTILSLTTTTSLLAHDLNPVLPCVEYDNNNPPADVKWFYHIELTDFLTTQTIDELDRVRGRFVDIVPSLRLYTWDPIREKDRKMSYYLTAISKSIPNNTTLKADMITKKGAGQEWKFNFIDVDDQIIKSYWLDTLDQCTIPSSWYLQDVKAFTVQPRDQPL
jgi:hypothetical protein